MDNATEADFGLINDCCNSYIYLKDIITMFKFIFLSCSRNWYLQVIKYMVFKVEESARISNYFSGNQEMTGFETYMLLVMKLPFQM